MWAFILFQSLTQYFSAFLPLQILFQLCAFWFKHILFNRNGSGRLRCYRACVCFTCTGSRFQCPPLLTALSTKSPAARESAAALKQSNQAVFLPLKQKRGAYKSHDMLALPNPFATLVNRTGLKQNKGEIQCSVDEVWWLYHFQELVTCKNEQEDSSSGRGWRKLHHIVPIPQPLPHASSYDLLCFIRCHIDIILLHKEGTEAVVLEEQVGFVVDGHFPLLFPTSKHFPTHIKRTLINTKSQIHPD